MRGKRSGRRRASPGTARAVAIGRAWLEWEAIVLIGTLASIAACAGIRAVARAIADIVRYALHSPS